MSVCARACACVRVSVCVWVHARVCVSVCALTCMRVRESRACVSVGVDVDACVRLSCFNDATIQQAKTVVAECACNGGYPCHGG